ncbi:MAG: hypothetical protein RLZZ71_420 [Bacteroidota bacterium]|jgi:hypothetical protein
MKTNQNIFKAIASLTLAFGAFAGVKAQSNLGAECGCPPVASRPTISVTSLPGYVAINGTFGGELTQGATFTCDKTYILDKKIYIPSGQSLNIAPGTVIKGAANAVPAEATALIISRGGKINAAGTESCPIVFTAAADPMDGTYGIDNIGKWGGVVVLGKASNNLTLAANGPFVPGGAGKLAVADGLGTIEGFATTNPQDQYGVAISTPTNVTSGTIPTPNTYSFTQNVSASTSTTITLTANGAYALPGMAVSGTGIAPGTLVSSVQGQVVTLNTATTGAVTQATFDGVYALPAGTAGQFFTGTAPTFTSGTGPWVGNINYSAPFVSGGASFDDNDNSGVMKYVSIRHSGAILAVGAEINGLTLGSVGRGTTIDHIEIVSCADDNIEIFGGTVNLKYITTLFGNDDMFDYDLGWKGKCQFFFGMKNTGAGTSPDNDNGIEADSDDNASNVAFRSHPILYNFTILGNGKATPTADNRGLAGANFKDGAEGELYNSIFANFKNGINLAKSLSGTPARTYNAWHNWRNIGTTESPNTNTAAVPNSLIIKCNTILMNSATASSNGLGIDASSSTANATAATTVTGGEADQFAADLNTVSTAALPGFSYAFTVNSTTNVVSVKNDVTPNPALGIAGCPTPPVDGFFEPANFRGAFSSVNGENWLSNWTYSQVLNSTTGVRACATDLNLDGVTDVNDFLIFAPAFGTSCN